MMKKAMALLAALILALMCAGCSGPAGKTDGTTENSVADGAAVTAGTNPPETAGDAGTETAAEEPEVTEEPETNAQRVEGYLAEADAYTAAAEAGMRNIAGYTEQLERCRPLAEGAGGDTAEIDSIIGEAAGIREEAESLKAKMDERAEKVKALCGGYESMGEEELDKLFSDVPKHLNLLRASLKKITKIDPLESATSPSAETRIRKLSEKAAKWFAETYPDLDPGEAFAPETVDLSGL